METFEKKREIEFPLKRRFRPNVETKAQGRNRNYGRLWGVTQRDRP